MNLLGYFMVGFGLAEMAVSESKPVRVASSLVASVGVLILVNL